MRFYGAIVAPQHDIGQVQHQDAVDAGGGAPARG